MKKFPSVIKDSLVGVGIGCAVIVPGISAGTIAVITNSFKKIVDAVDGLFSKKFFKNLLILLPFGLAGIVTVGILLVTRLITIAMGACLLAVLALFAGFIAGSIPGIVDNVKGEKASKTNIILLICGFFVSAIVGLFSVLFDFSSLIDSLFQNKEFYLYIILFFIGVIGSTGLIVPGFSGSAILLILGFYEPILKLGEKVLTFGPDFWNQFLLLAVFAVGVLVGFVLFSKLMNNLITYHKQNSYYAIIGFVAGSLISIFVNSNTFSYNPQLLDLILGPILLIVGFVIAYLIVLINRKSLANLK